MPRKMKLREALACFGASAMESKEYIFLDIIVIGKMVKVTRHKTWLTSLTCNNVKFQQKSVEI